MIVSLLPVACFFMNSSADHATTSAQQQTQHDRQSTPTSPAAIGTSTRANAGISMGDIMRISHPGDGDIFGPVFVSASPVDVRRLIACGLAWEPAQHSVYGYLYSSDDRGATWRLALLDNRETWVSEESCVYDSRGRAYYVASSEENGLKGLADTTDSRTHTTSSDDFEWHVYASEDAAATWRRIFHRDGWMDWTWLATLPNGHGAADILVVFADSAKDGLGHIWGGQKEDRSPARREVASESRDGGQTFSGLIGLPKGATVGGTVGGSIVLPNHTALFVVDNGLRVIAYSSRNRVMSLRSTIIKDWNSQYSSTWELPALAQDGSGRFRGRLYAAFTRTDFNKKDQGNTSSLWLAISDDEGYHWLSRQVLASTGIWSPSSCIGESIFDAASLAVRRDGTLGIMWVENARDVLFATSRDGGQTFGPSAVIARYSHAYDMAVRGVGWSDYYGAASLPYVQMGRDIPPSYDFRPGLTAYLKPRSVVQSIQGTTPVLTVDAEGTFHAFWSMPRDDDAGNALFTRRIDVARADPGSSPDNRMLSDPTPPSSCPLWPAPLGAGLPLPDPVISVPGGQHEVTQSIALRTLPLAYDYDARTQTIAINAVLLNVGTRRLSPALTIVGTNLHSDYGTPVAVNADGNLDGFPLWRASDAMTADGLMPGARSKPIHFVFRVTDFHGPSSLYGGFGETGVGMRVRVYETDR